MSDTARDAGIQALKNGDPKTALQHLGQAVAANASDAQASGGTRMPVHSAQSDFR